MSSPTHRLSDRLRINQLDLKIPSWVTACRSLDLPLRIPPAFAARVAVLAFGDELLDLQLQPSDRWFSSDGRKSAAAYLMPRAQEALCSALMRG